MASPGVRQSPPASSRASSVAGVIRQAPAPVDSPLPRWQRVHARALATGAAPAAAGQAGAALRGLGGVVAAALPRVPVRPAQLRAQVQPRRLQRRRLRRRAGLLRLLLLVPLRARPRRVAIRRRRLCRRCSSSGHDC
uniref:Uncharacterized protein n=1 Tax=Setaria viridis TaxID=4556 RepID=A0A4U6VMM1_SETVI|nr:hypothetical protein SEVIR_2G011850v2 [Setaria viridis]